MRGALGNEMKWYDIWYGMVWAWHTTLALKRVLFPLQHEGAAVHQLVGWHNNNHTIKSCNKSYICWEQQVMTIWRKTYDDLFWGHDLDLLGFAPIAAPRHAFWATNSHYRSSGLLTVVLEPSHWKWLRGLKVAGKIEERSSDFKPKQILLFRPRPLCKISWKSNKNCGRRSDDRHWHTDTQTDASDFMLCYSDGTDNTVRTVVESSREAMV